MWFCLKSKCLTHVIELVEEIASILKEFNSRTPISNGSIYIALSRTRRSKGWGLEQLGWRVRTEKGPPANRPLPTWPLCCAQLIQGWDWHKSNMLKAGTGRVQGDHYKMIKTSGRFWLGGSTSSRETSPIYLLQYRVRYIVLGGSCLVRCLHCWVVVGWLVVRWVVVGCAM